MHRLVEISEIGGGIKWPNDHLLCINTFHLVIPLHKKIGVENCN